MRSINRENNAYTSKAEIKMGKKVIVADDRASWRGIYANAIKGTFPTVQVDQVETGTDLVARVLQGDYSLVISDNDMEGKNDGLEALKRIRESGSIIPFYLVCSEDYVVTRNAMSCGANGFYDKINFDSDEVVKDIARYLR